MKRLPFIALSNNAVNKLLYIMELKSNFRTSSGLCETAVDLVANTNAYV